MELRQRLIEFAKWYESATLPERIVNDDWQIEMSVDAYLKDKTVNELNERSSVAEVKEKSVSRCCGRCDGINDICIGDERK